MDLTLGVALAVLGGALAVGLGAFGSAVGMGKVGRAGSAVLVEEPEKFAKVLLLEALPGSQGIYGFLVGIMLFQKLGIFAGRVVEISPELGWYFLFACLASGIAGLISGIHQGAVCAAGVQVLAKKPSEIGKSIILAAMIETYAILGLLITILLINAVEI